MIKCISYWSTPGGLENKEPINSALALTKNAGFDGIELAIGTPEPGAVLHTDTTQAECETIRKQIADAGLSCETAAAGLTWAVPAPVGSGRPCWLKLSMLPGTMFIVGMSPCVFMSLLCSFVICRSVRVLCTFSDVLCAMCVLQFGKGTILQLYVYE